MKYLKRIQNSSESRFDLDYKNYIYGGIEFMTDVFEKWSNVIYRFNLYLDQFIYLSTEWFYTEFTWKLLSNINWCLFCKFISYLHLTWALKSYLNLWFPSTFQFSLILERQNWKNMKLFAFLYRFSCGNFNNNNNKL